jgi:hypothetical protein
MFVFIAIAIATVAVVALVYAINLVKDHLRALGTYEESKNFWRALKGPQE